MRIIKVILGLCMLCHVQYHLFAGDFIHPGIDLTNEDLQMIRENVLQKKEPWMGAFKRLLEETNMDFEVEPTAHVVRGPYGKPNIGADNLREGANQAYNMVLLWYITSEKKYAEKARQIMLLWAKTLWDFDGNDARLLAGWTGSIFCNAAEILRYTYPQWSQEDTENVNKMMLSVYYPLLRHYASTANGNWDGAILRSLLAIAVFSDNRTLFDQTISRFLRAPLNGSLFKYVYPSGQCQETVRDQGHVQLGLNEFAGAARIAYTQGVDLFAVGGGRLGLGFEYTASFLLGKQPFSYGVKSERAKTIRDYYEAVYHQYAAMGIELKSVKILADSVRNQSSRALLISRRSKYWIKRPLRLQTDFLQAGAGCVTGMKLSASFLKVLPGESVQHAIDLAAVTRRSVWLAEGVHRIDTTLYIPSGTKLFGEGLKTVLHFDLPKHVYVAIRNRECNLENVSFQNMLIEGALAVDPGSDPNGPRMQRYLPNTPKRAGVLFQADTLGSMRNITFKNVTIQNFTRNGIKIVGAQDIRMEGCDFSENGSCVIPGYRLHHNVLLGHVKGVEIKQCRFDTSPHGCGLSVEFCKKIRIEGSEFARNGWCGIRVLLCRDIRIDSNQIEANDHSGILIEYLSHRCSNVTICNSLIQYNNHAGIEAYGAENMVEENNLLEGNGGFGKKQKIIIKNVQKPVIIKDY